MRQGLLTIAVAASLLAVGPAHGQSGFWRDRSGKPVAETKSMKSAKGFGGSLFVTTDADWREKWDTPADTTPSFNRADVVPYGKKVFVLIFFSNPMLDAQGNANLRCDLQIDTPAGEVSFVQKDMSCHAGKIGGSLYNTYLSTPVIAFTGDPGDPVGRWEVKVVLRDAVRGVDLHLRTGFGLREK